MKVSCDVIQDLLPLYAEEMLSADSQKLVEEHLPECEECRQLLNEMREDNPIPIDPNPTPIKKVQGHFRKKKIQAVVIAMFASVILAIAAIGLITAPSFLPFSEDLVTITQEENGNVIVSFDEKVKGYDSHLIHDENDEENVYFIRTWDSIWGNVRDQQLNDIVLNTAGERVDGVYYDEAVGAEGILIFGSGYSGSIAILSDMFYAYYVMIALVFLLIFAAISLVAKNYPRIREIATSIALLPTAYIIGHLFVLRTDGSSYAGTRDLFVIVLLTIPLYFLFQFIYQYRIKKGTKTIKD